MQALSEQLAEVYQDLRGLIVCVLINTTMLVIHDIEVIDEKSPIHYLEECPYVYVNNLIPHH